MRLHIPIYQRDMKQYPMNMYRLQTFVSNRRRSRLSKASALMKILEAPRAIPLDSSGFNCSRRISRFGFFPRRCNGITHQYRSKNVSVIRIVTFRQTYTRYHTNLLFDVGRILLSGSGSSPAPQCIWEIGEVRVQSELDVCPEVPKLAIDKWRVEHVRTAGVV